MLNIKPTHIIACCLCFFSAALSAQQYCTPTSTLALIYQPNTTSVPPSSAGGQYLCGPKTIVYDTLNTISCISAYVNTGSHLIIKAGCFAAHDVWVKNTATLTLLPGTGFPTVIHTEPGAVINNPSGATVTMHTCTSFTFPTHACQATGINESSIANLLTLKTWPNPAADQLHIEMAGNSGNINLCLLNAYGQSVYENNYAEAGNIVIPLSNIASGPYLLLVKRGTALQAQKLIVLH